jgi:hypothetical protein
MTVFDALLAPVMPILPSIEQQRRIHGNETRRWLDFVRILVFFFTERCTSRNAFVVALENADLALNLPQVPAMTVTDAFQRFPATLLRQALSRFIRQSEQPVIPELTLIGAIDAGDGSYFPVMGGMSYVHDTDTPRSKLPLDFDLSRLMAVDCVIGIATSNERQAYRTMLRENVTSVLDRGSMAFARLRDSIAAKAHVIMRACTNLVVETTFERASEIVAEDTTTSADVDQHVQPSRDATRPSANSTVASFLARLNQPLALFWKIPKYWLATLAEYLHRQCTSDVVKILNKRALANFKSI